LAITGVALSVPDVMDGGGRVYAYAPESSGICIVLDLRGRAQYRPDCHFYSDWTCLGHDRASARRKNYRESQADCF